MKMPPHIRQAIRVCMAVVLGAKWHAKDSSASPYICAMNLINWTTGNPWHGQLSQVLGPEDMAEWVCAMTDRERCALALRVHSTHKGKLDEAQAEHQS